MNKNKKQIVMVPEPFKELNLHIKDKNHVKYDYSDQVSVPIEGVDNITISPDGYLYVNTPDTDYEFRSVSKFSHTPEGGIYIECAPTVGKPEQLAATSEALYGLGFTGGKLKYEKPRLSTTQYILFILLFLGICYTAKQLFFRR